MVVLRKASGVKGTVRRTLRFVSVFSLVVGLVAPITLATTVQSASASPRCPWVEQSLRHSATPAALANEVLSKMTLHDKASFVVLATYPPLQNRNSAIASLCIPALSMTDGPDGLANGLQGVTQFPSAIALAATWDTSIARAVGVALAQEARTKGIAAVQGTEMNLARIPQSGRVFETYGEDPYLTSALGVANIEGIQSQGVMDNAKHFDAYTQETARVRLNQIVSTRALAELYDVPFLAAVRQAHVASLMCSYGRLNGVNTCSDPALYQKLQHWGFTGFVRSDLTAVPNIALAFKAGISLIKPASVATLERLVRDRALPVSDLNRAARSVLVQMFRFGMIAHPPSGSLYAKATTPAHAAVALRTAQNSIVLLKNQGSLLPLTKGVTSVAIIGDAAAQSPVVSGGGSSAVVAPYVITPLSALRSALGPKVRVTYKPGGPPGLELDKLSDVDIVGGKPLRLVTKIKSKGEPGKADLAVVESPNVTPALATASAPGTGEGWKKWDVTIQAKRTGIYEVSFQQVGDTWLSMNGRVILSSKGLHIRSDIATSVHLNKGQRYRFSATWFAVRGHPAPQFGIQDVTPQIQAAVASAKRAKVAIVFAGDFNQEGTDRPTLYLPGVADALISAVAAVNPHTIVVLNTGGAVYMPWISHVAAVLEAWYPGQEDGAAIASVLTGRVDPSGRLPITFPSSAATLPVTSTSEWPGINSVVQFTNELDIGYRWYQVHHVAPLFAFGYGLSYTSFRLSNETLTSTSLGVTVRVSVTNTGSRQGADVVQAYVRYPSSANEPPEQLRAFKKVTLNPGQTRRVVLSIPMMGLQVFQGGAFTTVPGQYGIDVGQSSLDLQLHANVQLH